VDFEHLKKEIRAKNLKSIYLLHGEEGYFIDEIVDIFEHEVLDPQHKAFDLTVCYGKDTKTEQVKDAVVRFPVLSEKQIVIIKEAQSMDKIEDLADYALHPFESTVLVIAYKNKKLDQRKKLYKSIATSGIVFESKSLYDNQLPQWIASQIILSGLKISQDNAALIASHLGNDLNKIVNEIEKLKLNIPKGTEVISDHVQTYIGISKEYNFFEFQKHLSSKNINEVMRIGLYFAENEKSYQMLQLISMLHTFFVKVYKLHGLSGKSDVELMRSLGLSSPYFVKEYKLAVSKFSRTKLEQIFQDLRIYDHKSKGIGALGLNNQALFKELLFKILN
jgi:DNA polymerase III subunit delta